MHRSSESVAALASALAEKAKATGTVELVAVGSYF
jgi:hypothetical protein